MLTNLQTIHNRRMLWSPDIVALNKRISDISSQNQTYAGITALTREISIDLLHSVTIYPDGRMDIRLNLANEVEALMEALRRESCTA